MKKYILTDQNNQTYESDMPGSLGGHSKLNIYGKLDCPSALRHIANGNYVKYRVFFADEETAIAAGYRPCYYCMRDKYDLWKKGGAASMRKLTKVLLGLENTDVLTIPIEKISILKINNENLSSGKPNNIEKPDFEICFNWDLEQSSYFNKDAEDIEGEKAYWLPFFQLDNFNVVDVELIYDDNSKIKFDIPYEDTGDFTPNTFETVTHPTEQEIHIVIKKEA